MTTLYVHKNDPEDSLSVVKRRSFQYDFEGFDVLAGLRKAMILLCAFATSASINKL